MTRGLDQLSIPQLRLTLRLLEYQGNRSPKVLGLLEHWLDTGGWREGASTVSADLFLDWLTISTPLAGGLWRQYLELPEKNFPPGE
jgi:hypothetical protein